MALVFPRSVVLADELTLFRDGLAAICEQTQQYRVVGQCADGAAAWNCLETLRPDIAVLDLHLAHHSVLEIIRQVRAAQFHTKMVLLALRPDRSTILDALRCGADAFLLKTAPGKQFLEALEHVTSDRIYLSPTLAIDDLVLNGSPRRRDRDPLATLSAREYQVFTMLVDGIRAKEIAARLEVSPKTIDTHRASLMRKLDIHDVAGLVKFAITRNLTSVA